MKVPVVISSIHVLCVISKLYKTLDNTYLQSASKMIVEMAGMNLDDNIPISK
jgi:hypothetical protein